MSKNLLSFTKMHGTGNDYIYINCLEQRQENFAELARFLSDRHFGIGGDGLVLILPSEDSDFKMRMFNADGSEAEMCGNAVRCVAKYIYEKKLSDKKLLTLETLAGQKVLDLTVVDKKVTKVKVDLGEPILESKAIPVNKDTTECINQDFELDGFKSKLTCVSMGNPHAVFFVDEITDWHVLELGPKIETHQLFPEKTNVEFVQIISPTELKMRVWERGTGETLACGTGAAAVLVAAVLNNKAMRKAIVKLPGGDLENEWADNNHVFQSGPAVTVFDGTLDLTN